MRKSVSRGLSATYGWPRNTYSREAYCNNCRGEETWAETPVASTVAAAAVAANFIMGIWIMSLAYEVDAGCNDFPGSKEDVLRLKGRRS